MTLQDIHEMNFAQLDVNASAVLQRAEMARRALLDSERFVITRDARDALSEAEHALSERFTALVMQCVFVEVCAVTVDDRDSVSDLHVAVVRYLKHFTHDVSEAQSTLADEVFYRFDYFEDVKRFVAAMSEIMLDDKA